MHIEVTHRRCELGISEFLDAVAYQLLGISHAGAVGTSRRRILSLQHIFASSAASQRAASAIGVARKLL